MMSRVQFPRLLLRARGSRGSTLLVLIRIGEGTASIAWMLYVFFFAQVAIIRYHVRAARGIRDNFLHDLFASCALYPMVISQMELGAPYIEQRKQV